MAAGIGRSLILALAFWPVWGWYARRMADPSDEPWGLLALAMAAIFLVAGRRRDPTTCKPTIAPIVLVLLYAATYGYLPPIFRAALALTALGIALSESCLGRPFHPGLWGLLLLSLPVVPSLQFYAGYPLRSLTAGAATALVRLTGFDVVRDGVGMDWGSHLILVDAPCSGVKMMWAGLFLAATLSCFLDLGIRGTALVACLSGIAVMGGNILRSAALFYLEAGILEAPSWAHEGVGFVVFLVTAAITAYMAVVVRRRQPCASALST